VLLPYRTVNGSAVAGQDFQETNGTLTNAAGISSWEVRVPLQSQPAPGSDRTFSFVVGSRTNTVRIVDEKRLGALLALPSQSLLADGGLNGRARGDGKLLVWGYFSMIAGVERTGIALLNKDGTVDESFRPPEILLGHRRTPRIGNGGSNAGVANVAVDSRGRLILAGSFSRVAGQPRTALIRLLPDGSLDSEFGSNLRFDGAIYDVVVQPDGRLVIGGSFEHINGKRRPFIARLLDNGAVDDSFQPAGGATSDWFVTINTLALQPDGKILMGGYFKQVDGKPMLNLARLNNDGTFDSTFRLRTGASGPVWRIRLQPDGKIVLGGVFETVGGKSSPKLARLNADGSNDGSFLPPKPNADVFDMGCLPDGRMLVHGNFTTIANLSRRFLVLLKADGTVDTEVDFGSGTDGFLGRELPVFADGSLYLLGAFEHFNGVPIAGMVPVRLGELAPAIRNAVPVADVSAEFGLTVHGLAGGVYPVEASRDLERWEPFGQVGLEGFDRSADLHTPAAGGGRFFRVKSR